MKNIALPVEVGGEPCVGWAICGTGPGIWPDPGVALRTGCTKSSIARISDARCPILITDLIRLFAHHLRVHDGSVNADDVPGVVRSGWAH